VDNGGELRGVITDWGGVLSTPILTAVRAWIEADGIGMTGVLHTEPASTARALQDLLGVELAWSAPAT
jgi:hypothetical protein